MYCRKCGENNPEEAIYCKNCGVKLKEEEVKKTEVIDIPATNNQNNQQSTNRRTTTTSTSNNNNSGSDWIGCCLCLIAIFIVFAIFGSL